METAVRLHRAGEGAPYEGLKPAGIDFGPVIPAAERALESGQLEALLAVLSDEMTRAVTERFEHALVAQGASKEPTSAAAVPAVRERISEELGFIAYVEGIYLAMKDGGHVEGYDRRQGLRPPAGITRWLGRRPPGRGCPTACHPPPVRRRVRLIRASRSRPRYGLAAQDHDQRGARTAQLSPEPARVTIP
jgi:hypothetical protein